MSTDSTELTSAQRFAREEAEAVASEASRGFTRATTHYRSEVRRAAWRHVNGYSSREVMRIITGSRKENGFELWQEVSERLKNTDLSPEYGIRFMAVLLLGMDATAILKERGCVWDPELAGQAV